MLNSTSEVFSMRMMAVHSLISSIVVAPSGKFPENDESFQSRFTMQTSKRWKYLKENCLKQNFILETQLTHQLKANINEIRQNFN